MSLIKTSLVVTRRTRRLVILYSRLVYSELIIRLRRLVQVRWWSVELVKVLVLVLRCIARLNLYSLMNSLSLLKLWLSLHLRLLDLTSLLGQLLVVVWVLDLGPNTSFGAFCWIWLLLGSRLLSLLLDRRCLPRLNSNWNRWWHSLKCVLLGIRYSSHLRGCFFRSTDLTGR